VGSTPPSLYFYQNKYLTIDRASVMGRFWKYGLAGLIGMILGASFFSCGKSVSTVEVEEDPTYTFVSGKEDSSNQLLEVAVDGVILNDASGGFDLSGGVTYGYKVQKFLEKASKKPEIKGIFLSLSTPGGTVVGSNAIFEALKTYRTKTQKPIIAYIEGLSASGGVMSMVGADHIYAAPGSLIGSIGVIGPALTYFDGPIAVDGGLLGGGITTRNGIQQTIISAGRGKDLGNPFRKPTEEELKVLREGINNEYSNFVQHVAKNRKIDEKTIRDKMGALIFDNKVAQQYKLIDGTKGKAEAIADLAKRAKVGDDFQLVKISDKKGFLGGLFGQQKSALSQEQVQAIVQRDVCSAVASRVPMVYYGNMSTLCTQTAKF
jgi:protease IV